MKRILRNLLLAAALVSVPFTLHAVVTDSALHISSYGYVGGAHATNGSNAANFSVGYNHLFDNSYYSAAIGYGLRNYNSYCTAVGLYNESTASNAVFLIGNGTSLARNNAFEVYTSGNINIPLKSPNSKFTVGHAGLSATTISTKIYGTADITRVPAKGGISMGSYTAQ